MATPRKSIDLDEAHRLADQGLTNRQIAEALGIGTVTLWKKGFRRDPPPDIDWEWLQSRLDAGEYLKDVAESIGTTPKRLRRICRREGRPELRPMPRFGERAPTYRDGRMVGARGYVSVLVPDHPYATKRGYVREHRLVMESIIGRYLRPEEVVHHIDENPSNNDPSNLELFANNGEHIAKTRKGRKGKEFV